MENQQFDELARTAAHARTRRGVLRALGGSVLGAGLTWLGIGEATAACKKPGKKCDKNKDCCNKQCKGRRNGKKGKCRCMKLRRRCSSFADFNDCCGTMSCLGPSGNTRCCKRNDQTCRQTGDCCQDEICEAALGGRKRCCLRDGEICKLLFHFRTCCNGLVCDDESGRCRELGLGPD